MKVRIEEDVEKKRNEILLIAKEIVVNQGLENLSIRKIAIKLNQTSGIIYHYFINKDEIIRCIVEEGYQLIVQDILRHQSQDVEKCIYDTFKAYIDNMLGQFFLFEIIMNTNDPKINDKVNILTKGVSKSRSSIQLLCNIIQRGNEENIFCVKNVELRAQAMWCATYGLIQRLAKEKPKNKLEIVEEHLEMLIQSLKG